jgi:uncharacterized protein YbjT (DUF2867 family)
MDKSRLHAVFGTGQVGDALAAHLTGLGGAVRAVSRHRPATMSAGIDWRAADVTDPQADADAANSARASPRGQLFPSRSVRGPRDV